MKTWLKCVLLAIWCMGIVSGVAWGKTMSIQIRDGQLRDKASFLGKITGTVAYGEKVQTGTEQAGWIYVTTSAGKSGWLHNSALTTKTVVASSGASDARTGASSKEVTLAGKGFSAEVEAQYKTDNPSVQYDPVDWMERFKLADNQLITFMKEGGLVK